MKIWSMKWRIIVPVGIVFILGISCLTWLIAADYSQTAGFLTERRIENLAYRYANGVKAELELSFGGARAMASFLNVDAGTPSADREQYIKRLMRLVENNPYMLGAWTCFEPDAFDGRDAEYAGQAPLHDATGRFVPYLWSHDGQAGQEALKGYDQPGEGDYYLLARNSGREVITTPYPYLIGGREQLITSISVPVKDAAGKVLGVAGADLLLEGIGETINAIRIYDTGYAFLVDHQGILVTHPKPEFIMKNAASVMSREMSEAIGQTITDGVSRNVIARSTATGLLSVYSVSAISIADTGQNWAVVICVPRDEAMAPVYAGVRKVVVAGLVMMVTSLIILFFLISRIASTLNAISRKMMDSSQEVADAAGVISSVSQTLSDQTVGQAAALEQTSSALSEMASTTRQNADNTNQGKLAMKEAAQFVTEGAAAIGRMSSAMDEINDSAGQISRIIKTIEDISFQTNLLALNAAVEAARAGEAGQGFAVVAEEVRNLSQRSAQAVQDTAQLIEATVMRIRNGAEIAARLAGSFHGIQESTDKVAHLNHEIAAVTNEQAHGMDQINTAVSHMDKATQKNAASSEESSAAAEGLSNQAMALKHMVDDLATLVAGAHRQ